MDPRVARTQASVVQAATDLLVEGGPNAVTVDAIVARSGVAKSTIYRHWESRDDILIAVIQSCAPQIDPPDPELGFVDGLHQLVQGLRRTFNDPNWERILPSLMLLKQHLHEVEELNEKMGRDQRDVLGDLLAAGVAEGAIAPGYETAEISALIVGPMLFAVLTGNPPLSEAFCRSVVDSFLASHASVPA